MSEVKNKKFKTKRDAILDFYKRSPQASNLTIANKTGASQSYVSRLIGPNSKGTRSLNLAEVDHLRRLKLRKHGEALWPMFRETQHDFVKTFLPKRKHDHEGDFSYFLPTDDAFASSGSGIDFSGSWSQYEYLAERRIGVGPRITRACAEDAVREGFQFMNVKSREVIERDKVFEWIKNTNFINELATVLYYERVYGVGFLISHYGPNDKKDGILATEQTKGKKPIGFEAMPPTVMTPVNVHESTKLDKNPQNWDLQGGLFDPTSVHHTRVRVFMTRPTISRWYGLSIFEPIWDSIIPYYQALIYLLKGFSKWGNMIPKVIIPEEDTVNAVFDKHVDVIEDMKANGTFIFPRGTDFDLVSTQLATGLRDMMEIWIEDMSAGTGVPVPQMMGRVVSSGLSGAGYLVAERNYWNNEKKIQLSITDDVTEILKFAGFKMEEEELVWHLAVTKTDQQRLMDEGMALENEIMKERLMQEKLMTDNMLAQGVNPEGQDGNGNDGKDDKSGNNQARPGEGPGNSPIKKPGNGGATQLAKQQTDFMLSKIREKRLKLMKELNLPFGVKY